jgi:hypothetical protein
MTLYLPAPSGQVRKESVAWAVYRSVIIVAITVIFELRQHGGKNAADNCGRSQGVLVDRDGDGGGSKSMVVMAHPPREIGSSLL